jgi:hypothetical protein
LSALSEVIIHDTFLVYAETVEIISNSLDQHWRSAEIVLAILWCLMIRFIEEETSPVDFEADGEKNFKANEGKKPKESRKLYFKAGGGITSKSDCRREYEEVIQKIYLPF